MCDEAPRKVRALINPRSGYYFSRREVIGFLREVWETDGVEFDAQESESAADGKAKAQQAIADGVDTIIVVGGDGMINTVASELIGSEVAVGVIPMGSGNGFARHFGVPLNPRQAAQALREAERQRIDVGLAAGRPFLVTCGLAWEAELVKGFEQSLIRGQFSYIFAGLFRFFTYRPQDFHLRLDGRDLDVRRPLILTVANLTQYGGGARIAPSARHDDGMLKLIVIEHTDALKGLPQLYRLFDGTIDAMEGVRTVNFRRLEVSRPRAEPIQVDGELYPVDCDFEVEVLPACLEVLVPAPAPRKHNLWWLMTEGGKR
jgi:YegS/Rv2252/BmrU family lipid kinase